MKEKAAVYARYSTDRQDARSIEDQVRRCRRYADANGIEVVQEFADRAESGAHSDRAGLQQMLAAARRRGGPPFNVLLIDDSSRLSRDMGELPQIVFRELQSRQIRTIDVTAGVSSDDGVKGKLVFGISGIVNAMWLEFVRSETHRGLEGRALKGRSTGGRIYGYRTEVEANPANPEHPMKVYRVHAEEAELVREMFREYEAGAGFASIAADLNRRGVKAPYDGVRRKERGLGWGPTTVRAILMNERYTGRFVWNKRKFVRRPDRKSRVESLRPEDEWIVLELPELALISREAFDKVQARINARHSSLKGRPIGSSRHPHLLSGVARCAVCGSGMGVVGQHKKAGRRYVTIGCSAHFNRGDAICGNRLTISELKLNRAILGALRERLTDPEVVGVFISRFNDGASKGLTAVPPEVARIDQDLWQVEKSIANLMDAVARDGWFASLAERLRQEENRRAELLAARSSLRVRNPDEGMPPPEEVIAYLHDLLNMLTARPEKGREILRRYVGAISMHPIIEAGVRAYRAVGSFDLEVLIRLELTRGGKGAENEKPLVLSDQGQVLVNQSCGGRI